MPEAQSALLMRVRLDKDDVVRFGSEEPAERRWVQRSEYWQDTQKKEHKSVWWRMEVRADARAKAIRRGDTLLLCRQPISHQQTDSARFKRQSKKARGKLPKAGNLRFTNETEMIRWIEALPHDYWENGTFFVAGVSFPNTGLDSGTRRERNTSGGHVFGVSNDDPEALEEAMLRSETAANLLRWTKEGSLQFWPKAASLKMKQLPRLSEDERERAPALLSLAIRMALSGPEDDSKKWEDRPAMDLADRLYRHLIHLNHQRESAAALPENSLAEDF